MFNSDFSTFSYTPEEGTTAERQQETNDDADCDAVQYQNSFAFLDEDTKTEVNVKKDSFPEFFPSYKPFETRT